MLEAKGRKKYPNVIPRYAYLLTWINEILPQQYVANLSTKQKCYWILNGIVEMPTCAVCGKPLLHHFMSIVKGYRKYCSLACCGKSDEQRKLLKDAHQRAVMADPLFYEKRGYKAIQTRINKYGKYMSDEQIVKTQQTRKQKQIDDPNYLKNIINKAKQTNIANGYPATWNNPKKMCSTRRANHGGKWESEKTLRVRKMHAIEKYGVDDANKSDIVKRHKAEAFENKYGKGIKTNFQTPQFKAHMKEIDEQRKQKELATKRKNKTFNTSKPEEECYKLLLSVYPGLLRQHRSEKYPFACDFYDPSSDTYFEFNGSWTHGGHWFDESSTEDQEKAQKWRDKGTKFYLNAVQTWTVRDVKKKEYAKKNKLKYVVLWTEDYSVLMSNVTQFESK